MDIGIQQQHGYPAPSEHAASAICAKDYIYYYYYYFFVQLLLDDIHTYIHTMHASKYVLEPASQAASISLSLAPAKIGWPNLTYLTGVVNQKTFFPGIRLKDGNKFPFS